MHVAPASGVWSSATTSIATPTPALESFQPLPSVRPLGGSSPFAALSAQSQSALLQAQEEHQPRP